MEQKQLHFGALIIQIIAPVLNSGNFYIQCRLDDFFPPIGWSLFHKLEWPLSIPSLLSSQQELHFFSLLFQGFKATDVIIIYFLICFVRQI